MALVLVICASCEMSVVQVCVRFGDSKKPCVTIELRTGGGMWVAYGYVEGVSACIIPSAYVVPVIQNREYRNRIRLRKFKISSLDLH